MMNLSSFQSDILSALRGQFSPEQFGARLFMFHEDIATLENYLVWFHERFHYLQSLRVSLNASWVRMPSYRSCSI